jgi:uncharacterized FlaG/YvyC family protein
MKWIETVPPKQAMNDLVTLIDQMHATAHAKHEQMASAKEVQEARHALMAAFNDIDDLVVRLKTKLSIAYSVADLGE